MDLYLCEKPSQAKDLASALNISNKHDGYISNGSDLAVTWAFGHLLELAGPQDYDRKYKKWELNALPITPVRWRYNAKKSALKQLKIIGSLLEKTDTVFIATDYDREGEAIARSLLDRFKYKGLIKRVCLTALDPESIRKALSTMKDGADTIDMYYSSLARARADWLVGMNMSRLYTVIGRELGMQNTIQVGRVLTPTINLVHERDQSIKAFTPSPFYELEALINVQNGVFKATWQPAENECDPEGRCINKAHIELVAKLLQGKQGLIETADRKAGKESPPLPFDLSALQQSAATDFSMTAKQTLDTAQALYENHKLISYPRTDCRYLPSSQEADIHKIFMGLSKDLGFSGIVSGADPDKKSRAFNDKKITAHHAIIPTGLHVDMSTLSETELRIFDLVRRQYIAQFYADHLFEKTIIRVSCENQRLEAKGKITTREGWKIVLAQSTTKPSDNKKVDVLPDVKAGEPCAIRDTEVQDKMTRPSPHFTEATLLAAMENVSRFVSDPRLKRILTDTSGIGTPATRAGIIEGACERGYLIRNKKLITATPKAESVLSVLPNIIKSPGMTAGWEQELSKIEQGEQTLSVFIQKISNWIGQIIDKEKNNKEAFKARLGNELLSPAYTCRCEGQLRRIKGKFGFFWGCDNKDCSIKYKDNNGKPEEKTTQLSEKVCICGQQMVLRQSKKGAFYGCATYPACNHTEQA